ncbi:hypothetical protein CEXT_310061 [Caerostris extrusa]|uniref:Secreted protein n=1 Tax=Caerostris extrusa TaxID=172846 RepID=A0AAV4P6A7_CAEEX|nr:hypothetical protein CEXT_310061 [Caerostris extrusa]
MRNQKQREVSIKTSRTATSLPVILLFTLPVRSTQWFSPRSILLRLWRWLDAAKVKHSQEVSIYFAERRGNNIGISQEEK